MAPNVYAITRQRLWLHACVFAVGGLWGITPALARIATNQGAHPIGLTLWQGIGGGAVLLIVLLLRGERLPLSPRRLTFYCVCGLTGTAIPTSLTFAAAQRLPVGIIALSIAAAPLLTYAIAIATRLDGLAPIRVIGILLGLIAVCLIVAPDTGLPVNTSTLWVLLTLLIPLLYAAENNIIAVFRPDDADALALLCGMLLCGGMATIPAAWLVDGFTALDFPFGSVEWATLGMIAINIISYGTFLYVIKAAGPVFASQANYLTMLSGVLAGMVLFGERHSLWVWVALGLMIFGMGLVKEKPKAALAVNGPG